MINSDYIRMKDAPYYPFDKRHCSIPTILNYQIGSEKHSFSKIEIYDDLYYLIAASGTRLKILIIHR